MRRIKARDLSFLIIITVGITLTLIWFRKGLLISGGESGDLFINPDRWLQSLRYLWQETYGTGISVPSYYPMISFYAVISFLKNLRLSMVLVQSLVFGFLLVSGALSMYFLTNALVEKDSHKPLAGLLAGLFYMLNPYSMAQVWNRFLYSQMFMYAFLPLLLLLFIVGLEKQKIFYAVAAAIVSVAFSVAYMHPASIIVQWAVLLSYLLFYLLMNRKEKAKVTYALKLSGTFALLWFLFNAWWILPFAKVAPGFFGSGYFATASENIGSLKGVSKYLNLYYVSRLLNLYQFFGVKVWGDIFAAIPFQIISWLVPVIVLLSVALGFRNRYVWYFAVISLFGLFFAKGATPPWENFLPDLFKLFPVLGIFRNPFEKIGIIIPMGYAFLFGTGITSTFLLLRGRLKIVGSTMIALLVIAVLVVYPWPMWTGAVFGGGKTSVLVRIPEYYARADDWISKDRGDFRILHLPVAPREGIMYKWPYGYEGYELNHVLFKKASISGTQWLSFTDDLYKQISKKLYTNQLWKMMALFNAKYIVLHNDIDYKASQRDAPDKIKKALMYIRKLDLANGTFLMRKEDTEEPAGWVLFWGDRTRTRLRWNADDKVEGNASLELRGYPGPGGKHLGVIYHVPKDVQDWSGKEFLVIWLKSNVSMKMFVAIGDGREMTIMSWEGREEPEFSISSNEVGSWKRLVFPLNKTTRRSEISFDFQRDKVKVIFIGTDSLSPGRKVTLKIGGVSVIPGMLVPVERIRYEKTFGRLELYKLQENHFLKHIYATNQFELTENALTLFQDVEKDSFVPGEKIIFLKSQIKTQGLQELGGSGAENPYKPNIVFKKVNPAQYTVKVRNATKPFFLVFSETYNRDWGAQINGKVAGSHFIANGYANAYYIDKKGSFQITLRYTPYALLVTGFWISVFALAISLIAVVWWQLSQKGNVNENSNS